jgi:hypothetical protein
MPADFSIARHRTLELAGDPPSPARGHRPAAPVRHVRHRLRKLTGRSWGVSMAYRLRKLAEHVRGWMGDFGISDDDRPIPKLDHWLRRRVRMC